MPATAISWVVGVLGTVVVLNAVALLVFYCLQDRLFYQPKGPTRDPRAVAATLPEDGAVLLDKDGEKVTFWTEEAITVDGLTLRGFRLKYSGPKETAPSRKRMIQYMHGTRVYLPRKIGFFTGQCQQMQADVIAFAYRGFSHSDGAVPYENGIMVDIDAITAFFERQVAEEEGDIETILWGKSFGCATSIVSHLSQPGLHESIVLESPFTSVAAIFLNMFPYLGFGRVLTWLLKIGWRNDQRIGDVRAPILFISGTKDPLTPNFMTHELNERATSSPRKQLYEVIGGTHNALYRTDPNFWPSVRSFFSKEQDGGRYEKLCEF